VPQVVVMVVCIHRQQVLEQAQQEIQEAVAVAVLVAHLAVLKAEPVVQVL
jgi:hypothetical protein